MNVTLISMIRYFVFFFHSLKRNCVKMHSSKWLEAKNRFCTWYWEFVKFQLDTGSTDIICTLSFKPIYLKLVFGFRDSYNNLMQLMYQSLKPILQKVVGLRVKNKQIRGNWRMNIIWTKLKKLNPLKYWII